MYRFDSSVCVEMLCVGGSEGSDNGREGLLSCRAHMDPGVGSLSVRAILRNSTGHGF